MYDITVIGGGMSGISAALTLARTGYKVAIFESFPDLAPTLKGFSRHGLYFDTGMHYIGGLGPGEVLDTYFRFWKIRDKIRTVDLPSQGFLGLRSPELDKDFHIGWGQGKLKRDLEQSLGLDYLPEVNDIFKVCKQYWEASPYLSFKTESIGWEELFLAEQTSVADYLQKKVSSWKLRTIFSYPGILMGVPPREAPLQVQAQIFGSYLNSVHYIPGQHFVNVLKKALQDCGVNIFCSARVKAIHTDSQRRLQSVELDDGQLISTKKCIYTGNPSRLPAMLPGKNLRQAQKTRLSSLQETVSAFVLYTTLNAETRFFDIPNWLVLRNKGWMQLKSLDKKQEPSCFHLSMNIDPKNKGVAIIAPCNFETFSEWQQSRQNKRPTGYLKIKQELQDKLLDIVYADVPELENKLSIVDSSTPLTLKDYCGNPCGGLYGAMRSVDQYPVLPMTKIQGLFLAGQGVIAPGILGATVSGVVAAGMISGQEKLLTTIGKYQCKE